LKSGVLIFFQLVHALQNAVVYGVASVFAVRCTNFDVHNFGEQHSWFKFDFFFGAITVTSTL